MKIVENEKKGRETEKRSDRRGEGLIYKNFMSKIRVSSPPAPSLSTFSGPA